MEIQRKLLQFLQSGDKIMGVVGPPGSGKKFAVEEAAKKLGLMCQAHDRTMGALDWGRLGAFQLCGTGFNPCIRLILNAHTETCWSWVKNLHRGAKVICIGNDAQCMRTAGISIEYVRPVTPEQMAKTLFLDSGWPLVTAQRVAKFSAGDWRQATHIKHFFEKAAIDIASLPDAVWDEKASSLAKDGFFLHEHPSLTAYKLFRDSTGATSTCYDQALAWGERNLGLLTDSLEDMCAMQQAAVDMDVLCTNGHEDLGIDCFVRRAATLPKIEQNKRRYDYKSFANPWAKPKVENLRRSTFAERQKQRLMQKEAGITPSSKKRAKPKRASTKRK